MIILFYLIRLYELVLIVRIFMSWMRPDPYHPVVQWIRRLTDPVLEPVRRMLPTNAMGIDFSPLIVFILLDFLKRILFGGYGVVF